MFSYSTVVTLRDADAAGVLFFARYFAFAHDAYEAFLASRGFSIARMLNDEPFIVPVVHAEADYSSPLWVGDAVTIRLRVEEVRRRLFTIVCELQDPSGKVACSVRTKHAVVNKETKRAIALPEELAQALQSP